MQAIESMLERVMSRIASEAPAEPSELLTAPSKDLAGHPSSRAPEVLAETITAFSKAPEVLAGRSTAFSKAPEVLAERSTASSKAPEVLPERSTGSSKAPAHLPDGPAGSSKAPAQAPARTGRSLKTSGDIFEEAYRSLLPAMLALRACDVVPLNISVPDTVTKALGIQPRLVELRGHIAESLLNVDERFPEHLVTHAHALTHAQTVFLMTSRDVDALPALRAEGKKLRAILLTDARGLIQRGRVDAIKLRGLKNDASYRNLAFDLHILAQLFGGCLASGEPTAVSATEIKRAEEIATTILTLTGRRKKLRASIEEAADLRDRAFTLFSRVYDETRRMVVYLRWHEGDADQLVPLLYAKRKNQKKKETVNTTPEASPQ